MIRIVAEAFYVGAYWEPRGESVEACAERLADQLSSLSRIDSLLASWFKTGRSRKAALAHRVDSSPDALRELLLAGLQRRDEAARSVMTEPGYSVSLWNSQEVQVGLSVRCGSPAAIPGMTSNSVSIQLPMAEGDAVALYRRDSAVAVLRSVITSWQPSWCTWTSHRLRKAQEPQAGEVVVGWASYVADSSGVRVDHLPSEVSAEQSYSGLLLVAGGDADSVSEATVSAVRGALGRALRATS